MAVRQLFLLALLVAQTAWSSGQGATNSRAVTTSTTATSTGPVSLSLFVSPSAEIPEGSPMNLTCSWTNADEDVAYLIFLTTTTTYTIVAMRSYPSESNRVDTNWLDDGATVVFQFLYTTISDSGVYECAISSGISSNTVVVSVGTGNSSDASTAGSPCYLAEGESGVSEFNVAVLVGALCGFFCILVGITLLIIRTKHRERFERLFKFMHRCDPPLQPVNAEAGCRNDDLPSYEVAVKTVSTQNLYSPPSYVDVVSGQLDTSTSSQTINSSDSSVDNHGFA